MLQLSALHNAPLKQYVYKFGESTDEYCGDSEPLKRKPLSEITYKIGSEAYDDLEKQTS